MDAVSGAGAGGGAKGGGRKASGSSRRSREDGGGGGAAVRGQQGNARLSAPAPQCAQAGWLQP